MFELNEKWVSTENQDKFIQEYFGKGEVSSKNIQQCKNSKDDKTDVIFTSTKIKKKRSSTSSEAKLNKKKLKNSSDSSLHDFSTKIEKNDSDLETDKSFVSNFNSQKSKKRKKRSRNKNTSEIEAEKMNSDSEERQCKISKDDNTDVISTSTKIKNKRSSVSSEAKLNKKKFKISSDSSLCDLPSKMEKNDSDLETEKSLVSNFNSKKSKKRKRGSRSKNKSKIQEEKIFLNSDNEELDEDNIEEVESESETPNKTSTISNKLLTEKSSLFRNKNYQKLLAAKFRYLNEMLYKNPGQEALSYFQENADDFQDYHSGYQSQVSKWPINPVDIIIQEIRPLNKHAVIADLGCGEAKIAEILAKRTVHSFDLIALKDSVTACDIAHVPLPSNSVDVAVFCLSLMGTNWRDYIKEAHRLLKIGGVLKIAEIESRIENINLFIENIQSYGFSLENKNMSHKMFVFLNFKKTSKNKKNCKVAPIMLKPCLYKKR